MSQSQPYAEIAIYQAPVGRAFTYSVPDHFRAQVGQLVEVSFRTGRSQGIITALLDSTPVASPKPILDIILDEPVVTPTQIALAYWMAEQTLTPLGACLWLNLPPGLSKRGDMQFTLLEATATHDDPTLQGLIDLLRERGPLRAAQIARAVEDDRWRTKIGALITAGVIGREAVLPPPDAKAKTVRAAQLSVTPEAGLAALASFKRSPRQAQLLEYLIDQPEQIPIHVLSESLGMPLDALNGALARLEEKGFVTMTHVEEWRDSLEGKLFHADPIPALTSGQSACWEVIRTALDHLDRRNSPTTFLLHGVTGSGKTEIYLRALDHVLSQGRQAIVLVPEISLVPQTVQRFASRFPGRVAVIHSSLTDGEQYDTWRRARAHEFDVVIGARSALFTPLTDVGLIVIDEEHDDSYKQSPPVPPPYYHAREAAMAMMRLNPRTGTVILGSATPSVITNFKAERGEITHLKLPNRVLIHDQNAPIGSVRALGLPPVEIVDMRHELRANHRSMFSRSLQAAMRETLAKGEQAILFLNRRGNATFVLCRDCGYVAKCPRCEMPLTFHNIHSSLICHACGFRQEQITICPECNSQRIKYFGAGTATIEEEAVKEFGLAPERVLRWDRDTTSERGSHERLMTQFAEGGADILVGTQMIVKGLDLPRVTLVGVVMADTALGLPDYRAGERTFQLLTQAAGRAGRGSLGGRAIFQTYKPEHYAIQAASQHDYAAFYAQEIIHRQELQYPPFKRLVRILIRQDSSEKAAFIAEQMAEQLRESIAKNKLTATSLIGPAPTFFGRTDNIFHWHIIARTTDPVALLTDISIKPGCFVDIDPLDIL